LKGALDVNEQFVLANSIDGTIYAIDKRTGDLKWIVRSSHPLSSPISISGSRLYMGTDNGYLVSLDQKTGATLWRYRTPGIVRAPIVNFLNMIFFGTDNGFVYSISEDDAGVTKLWRNRAGTGVQSLNYTHKGILVATQDNFVMLFAQQHGKRLWKKQLPARLASPPLSGSDGALFAPIGEEACIALSLFDGRQINTLFIGKDNSVVASPLIVNDTLIVPTRMGLLAFAVSK
jgi:outer membrane protein assembly factor BamB